jgi:hypothetical protein
VRRVIAALDDQGRWLTPQCEAAAIRTSTFLANAEILTNYLEAVK